MGLDAHKRFYPDHYVLYCWLSQWVMIDAQANISYGLMSHWYFRNQESLSNTLKLSSQCNFALLLCIYVHDFRYNQKRWFWEFWEYVKLVFCLIWRKFVSTNWVFWTVSVVWWGRHQEFWSSQQRQRLGQKHAKMKNVKVDSINMGHNQLQKCSKYHLASLLASQSDAHRIAPHRDPTHPIPYPYPIHL